MHASSAWRRYLKMPGRKGLDEICKLELLEATPAAQVAMIWNEHHKQFVQYWGRTISTAAYEALRPRLSASPYFVIPVFRDKGLFNVVTNFHNDIVGVSPLGEFQKKQDHTNIHMTIQFFTELSRSKQLVLVRCEIKDQVFMRQDCVFLTQMLLKYYTFPQLYETYVQTFNKQPNQFDYHHYLRAMKDEAKKDNIKIEDKKASSSLLGGGAAAAAGVGGGLSYDAYGPIIDIPPDHVARSILNSVDSGAPPKK